jgi:hypothetical protein
MRENDDGKTVAAMDLLVPRVKAQSNRPYIKFLACEVVNE